MKTQKSLFILLLVLFSAGLQAQNLEPVWELFLENERDRAEEELKAHPEYGNTAEALLLAELIRNHKGDLTRNTNFVKAIQEHPEDLEPIIESYFFESFLFNRINDATDGYHYKRAKSLEDFTFSPQFQDLFNYYLGYIFESRNEPKQAEEFYKKVKDIRSWKVVGPFENLNESGILNPTKVEEQPKLDTFNANSNGDVYWFNYENDATPICRTNFFSEYGPHVYYLKTYIYSPERKNVHIHFSTNGSCRVFLNEQLISEEIIAHNANIGSYRVKTELQKGYNKLFIKVATQSYSYFYTAVKDTSGLPIPDLTYHKDYSGDIAYAKIKSEVIPHPTVSYFKNKMKTHPIYANLSLANYYTFNGMKREAEAIFTKLLNDYPKSSYIRTLQLYLYQQLSSNDQVEQITRNIELDDPNHFFPIIKKVQDFSELQRMSNIEFKEFSAKANRMVKAPLLLSTLKIFECYKKEDFNSLIKQVRHIISSSDNPQLISVYSSIQSELEGTRIAEKSFKKALKKHKSSTLIKALAGVYNNSDQKEKANRLYASYLQQFENNYIYLYDYAEQLQESNEYEEAIEVYEQVLNIFPLSFTVQEKIGACYQRLGQSDKAIPFYQQSLSHNPGNISLRNTLYDLLNKQDLTKQYVREDAYEYIQLNRGMIKDPDAPFAELINQSVALVYKEGGVLDHQIIAYEVLNPSGIDQLKEYSLELGTYNYEIQHSEIIKPDGKRIPAERNGLNFVFNGIEVGDVIFIEYEFNQAPYGRFHSDYVSENQFMGLYPSLYTSFTLILPKEKQPKYKFLHGELQPEIKELHDYTSYTWTIDSLRKLPAEENQMPSGYDVYPHLQLSTIQNWNDISKWYKDLVISRFNESEYVDQVFDTIFPDGYQQYEPIKRAEMIYNYMITHLNYSFVSFKQSGFVPQRPEKTLRTKLGDCKDFSTLFALLGRKSELETNLVLVLTSDYGENALQFPSTDFNHCIVKIYIEDQAYYLELTNKFLPFLALPIPLENARALEIPVNVNSKDEYDIFHIPNKQGVLSQTSLNVKHTLGKNYNNCSITFNFQGAISEFHYATFSQGYEYTIEQYENYFKNLINTQFDIDTIIYPKTTIPEENLSFQVDLTLHDKLQKVGQTLILQPLFFQDLYTSSILTNERYYDLDYSSYEPIYEYDTEYYLTLDDGMNISELPENASLKLNGQSFKIQYEKLQDNKLKVTRTFKTDRKDIPAEEYEQWVPFIQKLLEAEKQYIGIKS